MGEVLGENTLNFSYKVQEIELVSDSKLNCKVSTSVPDASGSVANVLVSSQTVWYVENFVQILRQNRNQPWVTLTLELAQPQLLRAYSIRVANRDDPDNPSKIMMSGADIFRQSPESEQATELFTFHKDVKLDWSEFDTQMIDIRPRLVQTIKFKFKGNHGGEHLKVRQIKLFV